MLNNKFVNFLRGMLPARHLEEHIHEGLCGRCRYVVAWRSFDGRFRNKDGLLFNKERCPYCGTRNKI